MQQKVFEELFENYLQNTLSEVEEQKLMELIEQGIHDDFVKEKIQILLNENQTIELLDKQKGNDILQLILSHSETKTKLIALDKKRNSIKIAGVVLAVAATVMLFFTIKSVLFFNETAIPSVTEGAAAEKTSPILAYNGKQLIHLPDGSTILLNENSSIKYNQESFDNQTREVILTGEAYFDIHRNEKKPFIVHTGKVQTTVLGTAFNIKARNSSDNIEVTVSRGKVQVGDNQKIYGVITPNQQIKVNKNTLSFEQNKVSAAIVTEWKSNYIILDDINMEEAVSLISQKYKVEILLANEKIKKCRITASFLNEEDLDHILKVIASVTETEYHYNKAGSIVLEGKGCE